MRDNARSNTASCRFASFNYSDTLDIIKHRETHEHESRHLKFTTNTEIMQNTFELSKHKKKGNFERNRNTNMEHLLLVIIVKCIS